MSACEEAAGTLAGSNRHYRAKEKLCGPCRVARNTYYRDRYTSETRDKERDRRNTRRTNLRLNYGMSEAVYATLLDQQDGVCAVCQNTNPNGYRLSVDHDHKTGRVRGLLCNNCNRGIGLLRDDPAVLSGAIAYLKGGIPCKNTIQH